MTTDEAIQFYRHRQVEATSEITQDVYGDILDILKNQPDPLYVLRYRLEHATSQARQALFREAIRTLQA